MTYSSFPGASNETLLQKFNSVHKENMFYEMPQKREAAFIVRHYAGKVKYQVMWLRIYNSVFFFKKKFNVYCKGI